MIKHHLTPKTAVAKIVNGFVTIEGGGNPAGVVLNADGLTDTDMISIAGQVGLSETAFVSKSETEGFKLDFFTPNRRISHCGHATIATFSYLSELGLVSDGETSKETVDGPRKIVIKKGAAFMEQLAPKYRKAEDWIEDDVTVDQVLASIGLDKSDLDARIEPLVVNTGNNFLILGVSSAAALKDLKPNFDEISDISDKLDLIGYYIFTTDPAATDNAATTRMFAPRYAIEEEAATGMAAGPLACVLFDFLNIKAETMIIEQGRFMQQASPSLLTVNLSLRHGQIVGLMAGGFGRVMDEMVIEY
ncbi:MAG: PhzF family phenazine biosynthesis protein [Sneathiella sp.]